MNDLPEYHYGGARTMVYLQSQYLAQFLAVWRQAKAVNLPLPETEDPSYVSLETLLRHVLSAAGNYMIWMARQLELPDPGIKPAPDLAIIEAAAEAHVQHLQQQWRTPLADVPEDRFGDQAYRSNWGMMYYIDSMLEHAVMHPLMHRLQLEELLAEREDNA